MNIISTSRTSGEILDSNRNAGVYPIVNTADISRSSENVESEMKLIVEEKVNIGKFLRERSNLCDDKARIYGNDEKLMGKNGVCMNEGDVDVVEIEDDIYDDDDDDNDQHDEFDRYRPDSCFDERLYDSFGSPDSDGQRVTEYCSLDEYAAMECRSRIFTENGNIVTINDEADGIEFAEPVATTVTGHDAVITKLYENDYYDEVISLTDSKIEGIEAGEDSRENIFGCVSSYSSHIRDVTEEIGRTERHRKELLAEKFMRRLLHMRNNFFPFKRKKIWVESNRTTSSSGAGKVCKIWIAQVIYIFSDFK